jgi:hypothetical protein
VDRQFPQGCLVAGLDKAGIRRAVTIKDLRHTCAPPGALIRIAAVRRQLRQVGAPSSSRVREGHKALQTKRPLHGLGRHAHRRQAAPAQLAFVQVAEGSQRTNILHQVRHQSPHCLLHDRVGVGRVLDPSGQSSLQQRQCLLRGNVNNNLLAQRDRCTSPTGRPGGDAI